MFLVPAVAHLAYSMHTLVSLLAVGFQNSFLAWGSATTCIQPPLSSHLEMEQASYQPSHHRLRCAVLLLLLPDGEKGHPYPKDFSP